MVIDFQMQSALQEKVDKDLGVHLYYCIHFLKLHNMQHTSNVLYADNQMGQKRRCKEQILVFLISPKYNILIAITVAKSVAMKGKHLLRSKTLIDF
jgi:hypothetical protein